MLTVPNALRSLERNENYYKKIITLSIASGLFSPSA
jgi:hypothetical protein